MNAQRRKKLQKAVELLNEAMSIIEYAKDEEQECFDNLPEGIQYSERGTTMEDNIYNLEEIIDNISDTIDTLEKM